LKIHNWLAVVGLVVMQLGLSASLAGATSSTVATSLVVTPGNAQVTIGFTQPDLTPTSASPSGFTRLGYIVNVYQGSNKIGSTDSCVDNSASASESCVLTSYVPIAGGTASLANGTTYTFKIISRWSNGSSESNSDESEATSSATPFTVPTAPTAPTTIVNSSVGTSADISWTAPADNGESIDSYAVTIWNKAGTAEVSGLVGCTSATLTCTVSGLTIGNAYTFKVKATNSAGSSLSSNASSVFTVVAGAPTNVTAVSTVSNNAASVAVTWSAPTSDVEAIVEYTITATSSSGSASKVWTTGDLSVSFTADTQGADLTIGTAYAVTVKAKNAGGYGAESSAASVTPRKAPDAPTNVAATFTTTSAAVTWVAPTSNGGETITEYTASAFASSATDTSGTALGSCTSSGALTCTITGLTPSTGYKFAVKAKNDTVGYGAFSSLTTTVTSPAAVVAPGSPTSVTATFTTTSAAVTWVAPASNGGETIAEYTASAFASTATNTSGTALGSCTSSGALTCTITGLNPSTGYKFAVKAKNNTAGYGVFSSLSSTVTSPAVVAPDAPTNVAATFTTTSAAVTWVAPTSNGGETITEYTASAFASSATDTSGTALGSCTSSGALTCTITGLTPSTGYKFAVKAKNNTAGYGVFSSLSSTVTSPAVVAPAPVVEPAAPAPAPVIAPVSSPATNPIQSSPPSVPASSSTPAVSIPMTGLPSSAGTQVNITRAPSSAVATDAEVAISAKKVTLLLEVPKSSNAKTQITKYIIVLKPSKGASITKTITVRAGQVVKPSLSGKAKTTYTISVTAIQKSGKKSVWNGPKVTTK
jgi:hypothetical protein